MGRIKDLVVTYISLVKRPANGKGLVLKGERQANLFKLVKMDDELMRVYGIVYSPDQEDTQGDSTDEVTIRRAANRFLREGLSQNVDTEHSLEVEQAFVAESWLVRKGDPLFPEEPEGSWAVAIQVNDTDLWKQVKAGDYEGLSLYGYARYEEPEPQDTVETLRREEEAPGWFTRWVTKMFGGQEMTAEQIRILVQEELKKAAQDDQKGNQSESASKAETGSTTEGKSEPTAGPDGSEAAPSTIDQGVLAKAVEEAVSKMLPQLGEAFRKGQDESGKAAVKPTFI